MVPHIKDLVNRLQYYSGSNLSTFHSYCKLLQTFIFQICQLVIRWYYRIVLHSNCYCDNGTTIPPSSELIKLDSFQSAILKTSRIKHFGQRYKRCVLNSDASWHNQFAVNNIHYARDVVVRRRASFKVSPFADEQKCGPGIFFIIFG